MATYDKNTDYMALINKAKAAGDIKAASSYEAMRNAKIADMNSAGTNTNNYATTNNYGPKETIYYDPTGQQKTGYNIGGKTYLDSAGTQRLGAGNYTNVGNNWYMMGNEGGIQLSGMPTFRQEMPELNLPKYKAFNYKPFNYDVNNDDVYKQYAEMYQRQGQSAGENALASASAATGGIPSSYAAAANSQAQQAYAKKTADIIPTLEQNAYNRYANDRELAYNDYQNVYNAAFNNATTQYKADLDNVNYIDSRNDLSYDRTQQDAATAYAKYWDELTRQDDLKQQGIDNTYRQNTFDWTKQTDARDFSYNQGQDAIQNSLARDDNARAWAQYALSKDDNARQWEQFEYNKTQDALAKEEAAKEEPQYAKNDLVVMSLEDAMLAPDKRIWLDQNMIALNKSGIYKDVKDMLKIKGYITD